MTDKKLTDEEVVKALECCKDCKDCKDWKYHRKTFPRLKYPKVLSCTLTRRIEGRVKKATARQLSTTSGLTNGSGVYRLWLLSANTPRRVGV